MTFRGTQKNRNKNKVLEKLLSRNIYIYVKDILYWINGRQIRLREYFRYTLESSLSFYRNFSVINKIVDMISIYLAAKIDEKKKKMTQRDISTKKYFYFNIRIVLNIDYM